VPLTIATSGRTDVRVDLDGELDLAGVAALRQAVEVALRPGGVTGLTIGLAGLRFLDSTGIAGLIRARHLADAYRATFALTGAQGSVAWVLDVAGVGDYLGVRV
jgi:anti-sigma B factor antagonist